MSGPRDERPDDDHHDELARFGRWIESQQADDTARAAHRRMKRVVNDIEPIVNAAPPPYVLVPIWGVTKPMAQAQTALARFDADRCNQTRQRELLEAVAACETASADLQGAAAVLGVTSDRRKGSRS